MFTWKDSWLESGCNKQNRKVQWQNLFICEVISIAKVELSNAANVCSPWGRIYRLTLYWYLIKFYLEVFWESSSTLSNVQKRWNTTLWPSVSSFLNPLKCPIKILLPWRSRLFVIIWLFNFRNFYQHQLLFFSPGYIYMFLPDELRFWLSKQEICCTLRTVCGIHYANW